MKGKIKIAIAGVGNCAQALLHGIEYYKQHPEDSRGLMNVEIGGFGVQDIEPVAAFDINAAKVGKDLSVAIFAEPNMAYRYPNVRVGRYGVRVEMVPVLDGNPPHLARFYEISSEKPNDITRVLVESGAEMLLNFVPTESHQAARSFADAAIKGAKIGFVNGMPTLIVSDPEYQKAARDRGISGVLDSACSFLCKHPPKQIPDDVAFSRLKDFVEGKIER